MCIGDLAGYRHCCLIPWKNGEDRMAFDSGTTAWLLISTALVMLMTPAVGFFYGGMVRRKNFITTIALAFVVFALVSIQWVILGYTLAFGGDIGGLIGNLQHIGLEVSDPTLAMQHTRLSSSWRSSSSLLLSRWLL